MSIQTRVAALRHLAAIAAIDRAVAQSPWSGDLLARRIEEACVFVLEEAGVVQGYVALQLLPPEAEILHIAVHPALRRRGFGVCLMRFALERAKLEGVTDVHLEVRASNAGALALYQLLGFRAVGLRRGYYRDPCEDAILMTAEGVGGIT